MLSVRNLVKTYQSKKADTVVALNNVSIDFPETGLVFLLGKSGSGKSTLLNAIGGLDTFDSGEIIIKGKSSKDFSQSDFDSYRNTFIGFIFQEYNILENFSVQKNLALALELQGKKPDKAEIDRLLEQVEMTQYAKRKPNQLSGGQKQRVAIARALVKNPEIIMADEPTGALDSNTGKQVMETLKELSKTKLVIIVSHDREFAEIYGDRIIELKDGKIIQDVTKKEIEAQETQSGIKIIDDSVIYIKKGQPVSENDLKAITKIITENSQKSDTFISFDKKGNDALKKGAKITDDGNKEAFLDTEKEDIKVKAYNGNSLKLIKSRLKFSDSFKMGASALKNKVGKLVFTILLSFFAFTVFGIFDALSCWNRADSVYEAMKINKTKNVIISKQAYNSEWKDYQDDIISTTDLENLSKKFNDRKLKGIVGNSVSFYNGKFGATGTEFYLDTSTRDPLYSTNVSGFVSFTKQDIYDYGFEIYKGDLPSADDEIAISKYTMDALIKATEKKEEGNGKITEENILDLDQDGTDEALYFNISEFAESGYSFPVKVVGVVDDKTDYKKYKEMDSTKRIDQEYMIEQFFNNTFLKLAYVSESRYNKIASKGIDVSLNFQLGNTYHHVTKSEMLTFNSQWVEANKNQTSESNKYYTCKVEGKNYRLTLYNYNDSDNKYWYINEYGESSGEDVFYYNYSGNNLRDYATYYEDYEDCTPEDRDAFFAGTGIGIFGADANGDKIPDKFQEGYYSKEYVADSIIYYKGGSVIDAEGNFVDIGKDSIILSRSVAESAMGLEYEQKINEGFKINIYRNGKVVKEFTVVGVSNYKYYVSEQCMNETIAPQFSGYKMFATALTGDDDSDKAFITYCENGENGERFVVQNGSTAILNQFESIITDVAQVFFYIAIGFAVFASLMLMNFISTSISYKKREIGVLRALGARGSDIFGIFFNESMIIAMINFALAAVATIIGCSLINSTFITKLGMDIVLLNVGIRQVILILGVSIGAAFVGSFLPTFKISRKKPIDAINNR